MHGHPELTPSLPLFSPKGKHWNLISYSAPMKKFGNFEFICRITVVKKEKTTNHISGYFFPAEDRHGFL